MVLVEHRPRVLEVEVVLGRCVPRQRRDPLEVGADDAVLGRRRRQLLEPAELAVGRLARVLRQPGRVDLLAQLVHLGLLLVALAELLLDRLQLLAQEVLALALFHLRLHLGLDLRAELDHLELAGEDLREPAQPLVDVDLLQQRLLLLGLIRSARRSGGRARSGRRRSRPRAAAPRAGTGLARRCSRRSAGRCASGLELGRSEHVRRLAELGEQVGAVGERTAPAGPAGRPGRGSAACRRGL